MTSTSSSFTSHASAPTNSAWGVIGGAPAGDCSIALPTGPTAVTSTDMGGACGAVTAEDMAVAAADVVVVGSGGGNDATPSPTAAVAAVPPAVAIAPPAPAAAADAAAPKPKSGRDPGDNAVGDCSDGDSMWGVPPTKGVCSPVAACFDSTSPSTSPIVFTKPPRRVRDSPPCVVADAER
jgi:hypothetical protein